MPNEIRITNFRDFVEKVQMLEADTYRHRYVFRGEGKYPGFEKWKLTPEFKGISPTEEEIILASNMPIHAFDKGAIKFMMAKDSTEVGFEPVFTPNTSQISFKVKVKEGEKYRYPGYRISSDCCTLLALCSISNLSSKCYCSIFLSFRLLPSCSYR